MKVEHYRSRRKNVFAIICICFFWLVLCCICDCEWNWNWRWWKSTCVSTRYYRVTFVIVLLISRAELGNAFWGLFWPYATYRQASTSQFLSIWLSDICQPGSLSGFEFLLNMLWRQNSCSQHCFGLAPPHWSWEHTWSEISCTVLSGFRTPTPRLTLAADQLGQCDFAGNNFNQSLLSSFFIQSFCW